MKTSENGLFIFHRDLRIVDNLGLALLSQHCRNLYTVFIFTPEQVSRANDYKSKNAIQFMIESLEDLASQLREKGGKLHTFYGSNEKVIAECIQAFHIDVVGFNLDLTPYARERDDQVIRICEKKGVEVVQAWDYYLHEPDQILNGSGNPYQKFTPYYESAMKKAVPNPLRAVPYPFAQGSTRLLSHRLSLDEAFHKFVGKPNLDILVHGGRVSAQSLLKTALQTQKHYSQTRNELIKPTTLLSASIKFGCLSIREVYYAFRKNHDLIRQLYWREFYSQILYHYPRVLQGHALKPNYDHIKWPKNERWFQAWTQGLTGFPVVDAGMRQLATTGWLHNRARLIVASFLVKTLLIDWRKGEKFFATQLTDYDPANNNGNWEWIMGGGADSQPFFRIFNPWEQGKHYDEKAEYIKEWIPELRELDARVIHRWDTEWSQHKGINYPKPICDYKEQKEKIMRLYRQAFD